MAKHNLEKTAEMMHFTTAYIRSLIRKGLLVSEKEPIVPESLVTRHMISDEEIARFMGQTRRTTHRVDGRNKFVVYMDPVECEKVKRLLTENELEGVIATLRSWNPLKPKSIAKPKAKKARRGTKTV